MDFTLIGTLRDALMRRQVRLIWFDKNQSYQHDGGANAHIPPSPEALQSTCTAISGVFGWLPALRRLLFMHPDSVRDLGAVVIGACRQVTQISLGYIDPVKLSGVQAGDLAISLQSHPLLESMNFVKFQIQDLRIILPVVPTMLELSELQIHGQENDA
jgi:hypothetical protein